MKRTARFLSIAFPCAAMLILILDSKTALLGAQKGLELCLYTVIPSLFPFFVISILLTNALSGCAISFLKPLTALCKMPTGSENLLLAGLLGGYPVGAKCVYDMWKCGQISTADARRCLGFCSNAGPAFIFGMCSVFFSSLWTVWVLWGIHILSALLVGNILPQNKQTGIQPTRKKGISLPQAMAKAMISMSSVCGWVMLFRVIIAFAQRWFLCLLPSEWVIVFEGILELANGCSALASVESEGLRFILCASFLGLGSLCVGLQTISVVGELGTGMYFPGKVAQCLISCCLAAMLASLKYRVCSPAFPAAGIFALAILILLKKKTVAFQRIPVYNDKKDCKGRTLCYSERKLQSPAAIAPVEPR